MSSAQDASIFQSALLAPFPRLTAIAAVVLTLLTAPVANASVIAAVKNAQGNDVILFELLSGAESGTGEDVSAADQGALLEAGAWLGEASICVRHPGRHTITALLQSCPRTL